jgi:hypothetical protein
MTLTEKRKDIVQPIFCSCGSKEYRVKDNRSKELMLLVCNECGNKQEWKLRGYTKTETND